MAFVRLYHDDPGMTGGPTTADVPEEAVPHWRKAGWHEAEKGRPENADNVETPQPRKPGRPPRESMPEEKATEEKTSI